MNSTLKSALAVTLLLLGWAAAASAQTYTVLKHFTGSDGRYPSAGLTLSGSTLYGTTYSGGSSGYGTVFKVNTDGTGFTVLKHFTGSPSDGSNPRGGLTLDGSTLYGTTFSGGSIPGSGTLFKMNTNGTGYTELIIFGGSVHGSGPRGGLTLSGSTLYGTTYDDSSDCGTVFKVNTDGTGYNVLEYFSCYDGNGSYPSAGLTLSGSTLYGTTSSDGISTNGTVFKLNTNGTGYTVLKHFTGSDGANPGAGLTLSGSTLYGTTYSGGSSGYGTVFKVNTDGMGYIVLKHFNYYDGKGSYPLAGLTLSGSTLYGTTYQGGNCDTGTVFKVNTDGTVYTVLKHFTGSDGANPGAGLTLSGSMLYGTTSKGGSSGRGTVFCLNLAPVITAQPKSRTNVVGTTATFTVAATGETPLACQWRFDGTPIGGATSTNYSLASVQSTNVGNYTVVVTNTYGSVTSLLAALTVWLPPTITTQPQSRTNNAGAEATFTVTATSTAPLSYQWKKNGTNSLTNGGRVSGATTAMLTLSNVTTNDAGSYSVVVTNAAGSVTSSNALLTVIYVPHFETSPESLQWTTNGFQLTLANLLGRGPVTIYASTNLVDWELLLTNPPVTGALQFIDIGATNWDMRFYRASEQW